MIRHARGLLLAGIAAALIARPAAPATAPTTPAAGWPPDPALAVYPEAIEIPQDAIAQGPLRLGQPGLRDLGRAHPRWQATVDPFTGSVDRAFGDGIDLEEPSGRAFLARWRGLMAPGVESNGQSLVANAKASAPLTGGSARFLAFDLFKDGLPVIGAGLSLGVRDGKVVLLATRALGPVTTSSRPKIDAGEALAGLTRSLGLPDGSLALQRDASLAFYPRLEPAGAAQALRHHLVWRLEVRPPEAPFWESWNAWVDAHDGRLLAFFPEARTLGSCAADPNQARGTVLGGVRPNRADDPETIVNLPFAQVSVNGTLVVADRNGRFPYAGGSGSGSLAGDVFRVHCDNCTQPSQPFATVGPSGALDYGSGGGSSGPPVFGNGLSTPADRAAYYHLHQARQLMSKWDGAFFDEIEAFVNIAATCNAFSTAYMVGFYEAGGGCRNTGEIRDVMQHELGHNWDRFDGNDITDDGMSEWKGDLMALTIGGDACMAESFHVSTGFPSPNCSGVRDLDEKTVTGGVKSVASNPCGTEPHCLGEIPGQATWHLLNDLSTGVDYATGAALPAGNPALSPEEARWILERLLIGGGPPMQVLKPSTAGVSIYDAVMVMDDDDANLANGTPHAAYINAAFSHHGLTETPQVGDSAGCAPLADPLVTATVDRDPATSLPLVSLSWVPQGGATNFEVYRNTRAGDAFLPLARGLTAGPFVDPGVQVGATYRYFVAATRRTGCADISPGNNIVTVTIAPAELRVGSATFSEAPGGSDGDGRIEPGERVTVHITLKEIANASGATGVSATIGSASPDSPVTAGGPVLFGSVPAGGTATGASDFEVYVGPAEVCGGSVHLILSATGNEGCWLDQLNLPIDATAGCAVTPAAFVEVVPGSLHVTGGTGDGDLIADNCEAVTASFQIRNTGSTASGPAVAAAGTTLTGVTFAPPPSCAFASLAGGGSASCQFTFSLSGAAPGTIPFTLTANASTNAAPSVVPATLTAESNPPVFATQTWGFEGSLQGWTAKQFALSTARASSGAQSAHSGSLTQPNICGKLTSPALLLNPAAGSTLSFSLYADIEPLSDQYYDRANVHVVDVDTGVHTVVTPVGGAGYFAFGNPQGALCHISNQQGWAGQVGGFFVESFDLSAWAGRRVRIEINYNSDELDNREGIYVDDVSVTNAASATLPPDLQSDVCSVPEVSPPAAAVPLDVNPRPAGAFRFTWQDLGPGLQYNLYAGTIGSYYSHGATPVACSALGAGATCDGVTCTLDEAGASLPAGSLYFLVTGTEFGREGTSGFASSGAERDPSQSTCAP